MCTATAACSSNSASGADASTAGEDAGAADSCAPIESGCGQPCDTGNSLGVGLFCTGFTQCNQTQQAHLCSSLNNSPGNLPTYFCTFRCQALDAATPEGGGFPTSCGENAECTCDNTGNCGCTPSRCLGP
jgi:hypothetical protein